MIDRNDEILATIHSAALDIGQQTRQALKAIESMPNSSLLSHSRSRYEKIIPKQVELPSWGKEHIKLYRRLKPAKKIC